jgi:hypothetical protein
LQPRDYLACGSFANAESGTSEKMVLGGGHRTPFP